MKKTIIFLRHAGQGAQFISYSVNLLKKNPSFEGKNIKVLASSCETAAPTVSEVEKVFSVTAVKSPLLAKPHPKPEDLTAVIKLAGKQREEMVLVVSHADYTAMLPNAFGNHYGLASVPPIKDQKHGEYVMMKVPPAKVQAVKNEEMRSVLDKREFAMAEA